MAKDVLDINWERADVILVPSVFFESLIWWLNQQQDGSFWAIGGSAIPKYPMRSQFINFF